MTYLIANLSLSPRYSTFDFSVPFLSILAMVALAVASLLLFFVPLRYIILVWGINKFTKKLRSPNAIDNNELMDFLSRVPDTDEKASRTCHSGLLNLLSLTSLCDYENERLLAQRISMFPDSQ